MNKNTLRQGRRLLAGILGLALFAAGSSPLAYAAPGTPTVAGSAGQTSGTADSLDVTTTATINPGDLVVIAAASASNQTPWTLNCVVSAAACRTSWNGEANGANPAMTGVTSSNLTPLQNDGRMDNDPIRARTFFTYATSTIASGATFKVQFPGAVGAKSATVVVIPSAQVSALLTFGNATGTSASISPGATPSIPTGQLVLATSFVSGGGSDSYTEDAGFTFLHQTSAGAWPAIRVAYKLTSGSGAVPYTLTNTTSSRTWISSYQIAK